MVIRDRMWHVVMQSEKFFEQLLTTIFIALTVTIRNALYFGIFIRHLVRRFLFGQGGSVVSIQLK
jgi:hypothetical protein